MPQKSIAIIGGGFLGMTLALQLRERGYKITLFEQAPQLGGLASSDNIGPYTWDRFYHVLCLSDTHLLHLLAKLGLKDQVAWKTTKTGFFSNGRLYSMSNIIEFLRFPPLNLLNKFLLGFTIFYVSRIKHWQRLENIQVTDWLQKLSGKVTFNKIWLPLLQSKLGDNYKIANASFIWAIINRMYAARRAGFKRELFGYVPGGYAKVLQNLEQFLSDTGVEIKRLSAIEQITQTEQGVELKTADTTRLYFDEVILTIPSETIAQICPQLTPAEKQRLATISYQGIICASLLVKKPLSQYYITNITDTSVPFTAVIEMTALVDSECFDGHSLIYLPYYLTQQDSLWKKSEEEIEDIFLAGLQAMHPTFKKEDLHVFKLTKASHVFPIPTLRYSTELQPPSRTSLQNVFIVNSSQIVNGTMNVNEVIGHAQQKAEELAHFFSSKPVQRKQK